MGAALATSVVRVKGEREGGESRGEAGCGVASAVASLNERAHTTPPWPASPLTLVHAGFLRRAEDSPYLERYCDAHDVKVRKKGWWGATQVPCAHNRGGGGRPRRR